MLDPDALLRRLASAEVNHIIVGGVAVAFHGVISGTKALDICSLGHLRAMKKAAGRPQDLKDLADLEIANG